MTSQGRRKHSACLFRIRENCPFRRLRRSVCNDSRNALVPAGGQWRSSEASPEAGSSATSCGVDRPVSGEPFSTPRPQRSDSHPHEFPVCAAMDTDMDPPTASRCIAPDAPGPSNFRHINQQCRPSSSDTFMDLDNGVDPETGERAQG